MYIIGNIWLIVLIFCYYWLYWTTNGYHWLYLAINGNRGLGDFKYGPEQSGLLVYLYSIGALIRIHKEVEWSPACGIFCPGGAAKSIIRCH